MMTQVYRQTYKCSAVAEMGDHLATIDMDQKLGVCVPLGEGELGPHLTQCDQGWGLPPYQVASWSIQPFGHNWHGPKIGDCAPLGEGSWVASNTMWPGPRPISMPSFILIHPAVRPQQTCTENWGCCAPFFWGGGRKLGPYLTTQCGLGRGLPPYHMASWSIQPFGYNTPMSQTGQARQRSDRIGQTKPFYKPSSKN